MSVQKINDLGFLLHSLAALLDRQSDEVLQDRLDIGFSQFKILFSLKWKEGVQQKDIAATLGQTEASVSRQIKLLQDAGFITSKPSHSDRRQHITTLTRKGENVIDKALRALENYHRPVFARLTEQEQLQLHSILERLHDGACQGMRAGGCQH